MKNILSCIMLFLKIAHFCHSQDMAESIRACNEALNADVRSKHLSYNQENAKAWFYEYFKSNSEKRSSMKKSRSNDFGLSVLVEGIPISGTANFNDNSTKDVYNKLETTINNEGFVSDDNLTLLITSFMPKDIFTSYDNCLKVAGRVLLDMQGLKVTVPSQTEELVVLKMDFRSIPAGKSITIANADYTNGDILHGKKFTQGTVISDGQSILEQIRRRPGKDLVITISFVEPGVPAVQKTISADKNTVGETNTPIGTIIASILPYDAFMKVNGFGQLSDLAILSWVPCDGRTVTSSRYSQNGGGADAPDLRGVFLRGINDYHVAGGGVEKRERWNPTQTIAGEFQKDAFQGHRHNMEGDGAPGIHASTQGTGPLRRASDASFKNGRTFLVLGTLEDGGFGSPRTAGETRPNNITVYYYLKIN